MVTYLTHKQVEFNNINVVTNHFKQREIIEELYSNVKSHYNGYMAIDTETTGLDPYYNDVLLTIIGTPDNQIVIDNTTVDLLKVLPSNYSDYIYIAHHAKFDNQMLKVNCDVHIEEWHCTMVADQKIWQNAGIAANLVETIYRNLGYYPESMNKDIRLEFVGRNVEKFVPTLDEVFYGAGDVTYLHPIKDIQRKKFVEYNLLRHMNNVEFPLIEVLSSMELSGVNLDENGWRVNIKDNIAKKQNIESELDSLYIELRDRFADKKKNPFIFMGKWNRKRHGWELPTQLGMFGEHTKSSGKKKPKTNIGNINYNSPVVIQTIFAVINLPLPTKEEGIYAIPILDDNKKPISKKGKNSKGKTFNHEGTTTKQEFLIQYIIDFPDSPAEPFIRKMIEYSKVLKELSTYGEVFLSHVNKVTGRLHTVFRQAHTANSRLASGGGKLQKDRPNQQNIPRNNTLRNCFHYIDDNGKRWRMITADYTGAEVTIMADKSNDKQLYQWAVVEDDSHSPIATKAWRSIFYFRAGTNFITDVGGYKQIAWQTCKGYVQRRKDVFYAMSNSVNEKVKKNYELFKTFIVNKKVNKPYRQSYKNLTFGSIYGCKPKKAASTLNGTTGELRKIDPKAPAVNVTIEEAKVVLRTMKETLPDAFRMVEKNVRIAFRQGYLVLNERSNSRVWFPEVVSILNACNSTIKELKAIDGEDYDIHSIDNGLYTLTSGDTFKLDWDVVKDVDGQARNLPISGTQADMIKESMVVLYKSIKYFNLKFVLLMQVHDELVVATDYDDDDEIEINHSLCPYPQLCLLPSYKGKANGYVAFVMNVIANLYLNNIEMKTDYDVEDYWLK